MSVLIRVLVLVQLLARLLLVQADVSIVKPEQGDSYKPTSDGGSVKINIVWEDDANLPSVPSYDYFTFKLLYGPSYDMDLISQIEEVSPTKVVHQDSQYTYTANFVSSKLGNGQFFIQVYAFSKNLGWTIHYSPRFNIQSVSDGVLTYTYKGQDQPGPQWNLPNAGVDTRSFTLPYTAQTGVRRYAPMQTQPGSRVTVTTWSRRFPTSSVSYYTTKRNSLDQMTTYTPGWSYTVTSDFNYATPAPFPSDNGGWYNPKKRQSLTTRKLNINQHKSK